MISIEVFVIITIFRTGILNAIYMASIILSLIIYLRPQYSLSKEGVSAKNPNM